MPASTIAITSLPASSAAGSWRALLSEGRGRLLRATAGARSFTLTGDDHVALLQRDIAGHDFGEAAVRDSRANNARLQRPIRRQDTDDLNLKLLSASTTAPVGSLTLSLRDLSLGLFIFVLVASVIRLLSLPLSAIARSRVLARALPLSSIAALRLLLMALSTTYIAAIAWRALIIILRLFRSVLVLGLLL